MLAKLDTPLGRSFQLLEFAISIVLSVYRVAYSPQSYNVYNYFPNKRAIFCSGRIRVSVHTVGTAQWNLKKPTCTTNRFFEDVPRNVPTLWMARSWVYSNNDLLHLLTHHKLEALEHCHDFVKCGTGKT
jgi:hypothetical protein